MLPCEYLMQATLEEWSKVLWRDAHFSMLESETKRLKTVLQELPKHILEMDVAKTLSTLLDGFCDSIALSQDLRHEALNPR